MNQLFAFVCAIVAMAVSNVRAESADHGPVFYSTGNRLTEPFYNESCLNPTAVIIKSGALVKSEAFFSVADNAPFCEAWNVFGGVTTQRRLGHAESCPPDVCVNGNELRIPKRLEDGALLTHVMVFDEGFGLVSFSARDSACAGAHCVEGFSYAVGKVVNLEGKTAAERWDSMRRRISEITNSMLLL